MSADVVEGGGCGTQADFTIYPHKRHVPQKCNFSCLQAWVRAMAVAPRQTLPFICALMKCVPCYNSCMTHPASLHFRALKGTFLHDLFCSFLQTWVKAVDVAPKHPRHEGPVQRVKDAVSGE